MLDFISLKIKVMNLSRSANWYTAISLEGGPAGEVLDTLINSLDDFIQDIYIYIYLEFVTKTKVRIIYNNLSVGNLLRLISMDYSLLRKGVGGKLVVYKVVLGIVLVNLAKLAKIIWNNICNINNLYGTAKGANLYLLLHKEKSIE